MQIVGGILTGGASLAIGALFNPKPPATIPPAVPNTNVTPNPQHDCGYVDDHYHHDQHGGGRGHINSNFNHDGGGHGHVNRHGNGGSHIDEDDVVDTNGPPGHGGVGGVGRTFEPKSTDPLERARERLDDAREGIDKKIDGKSEELGKLMGANPINQEKVSACKREIEKLTNNQQMLMNLENQLMQMIQNIMKMRHDTAMNSVRHLQ